MDSSVNKVILLFKTHLDVGFTDYASTVIDDYIHNYIPTAIRLANSLKTSGREERFVWTVGSWMIARYLETAQGDERVAMERALCEGDISYHALPFTMHTEAMDAGLFRYGLSIAKQLDQQFGRKTIAGKYTDVPGHTKAMIPLLSESGIQLVHIGVNPASAPPDVPDFFVWRFDHDNEVTVVYNKGYYGEAARIPNTDTVIHFAHTNDNCGPQTVADIRAIYDEIRTEYPNANIVATDLDGMAREVLAVKDMLPVVTEEIGDTWIHGVGTDPHKVSNYRALLRLAGTLPEPERGRIYKPLLSVPEHTWGMDEKTHLNDHETFTKQALQEALRTDKYQRFMTSWDEQRSYITQAVDALSGDVKTAAEVAVKEYKRERPNMDSYTPCDRQTGLQAGGYTVSFDDTGAISSLYQENRPVFDPSAGPVGSFSYQVFGAEDFERFQNQYLSHKFDWALEDFGKIGCGQVLQKGKNYLPRLKQVYQRGAELLAELEMPEEAYTQYGCPRSVFVSYLFDVNSVKIDLSWFDKDANRLGEALWFSFHLPHTACAVRKLGQWVDTQSVVSKGGRALHASDFGVKLECADKTVSIESLDTALIAPGAPSLLNFTNKLPDMAQGIAFNLYNNVWGTNFPMWYQEDARFRFVVSI